MSALLLASVIAYSLPAFAQGPGSTGKSQVEYVFGEIPGKDIIVHIAVIIPPGFDKNEVINQALNYQGAKKIEKSEYSIIETLKWGTSGNEAFPVEIKYNVDNEPQIIADNLGDGKDIFEAAILEWNEVSGAPGIFLSGDTTICPSLVKECGSTADGENGFGWAKIRQPNTLGVTYWKTTADFDLEVDVVLSTNNKISWSTNDSNYNIFTVSLHELGHALGLAHSETRDAVMYPSYQEAVSELYQDDICGVYAVFEIDDDACTTTIVPPPTSESGVVSVIDVTFQDFRNGLKVTLDLKDDQGVPVDATIQIRLLNDGDSVGTASGTTEGGSISWVKRGNSSGCYTIEDIFVNESSYTELPNYTSENCFQ